MNTKISQGMVLVASNSNSTVESWVQDGSFRAVDDECFRPGQEGMMMNFEPVRSFQNYGGMVSRKVNSEMCYKTSFVSILKESFLENIKKGQGRDFLCLI